MRICSDCQRCFDDSEVYCTEEAHPALSKLRDGGPDIIPGYRLDLFLGSDTRGENYYASETVSGGPCLISIISTDETHSRQFLGEADLATAFCHPNAVDVYDTGYLDTGEVFVVSEDPEGNTLRDLLEREGVPRILTTIQVVRQTAEALYALHMNGLKHGAINPENILLTSDAQNRLLVRVRDLDFGDVLGATIVPRRSHVDADLYTLRYFAPEQCSGAGASEKTDIYSLGIVLHEMLAGTPPFNASKAVGLIEQHRNQRPPEVKVDHFDLRMLVTHTLMEALQKQPEMRQASANVFARQMRHMEQLVTHASVPPPLPVPVISRKSQVVYTPRSRSANEGDIQPAVVAPFVKTVSEADDVPLVNIGAEIASPVEMAASMPAAETAVIRELPFDEPIVEKLHVVEAPVFEDRATRSRRKSLKRRLRSMASPMADEPTIDEATVQKSPVVDEIPPEAGTTFKNKEPHRLRLKVLKRRLRSLVSQTRELRPAEESVVVPTADFEELAASKAQPHHAQRKASKKKDRVVTPAGAENVVAQNIVAEDTVAIEATAKAVATETIAKTKPVRTKAKPKATGDLKPAAPAMAAVASARNVAPKIVRSKEPEKTASEVAVVEPSSPEPVAETNVVETVPIAVVPTTPILKEPKKIVWEQPEDDIPSLDDVMQALAFETAAEVPLIQASEASIAAPVLKRTEPKKIEWEQPEDDIPSIDDVMDALGAESVSQIPVVAAEPTVIAAPQEPAKVKCEEPRVLSCIPSAAETLESGSGRWISEVPVAKVAASAVHEEPKKVAKEMPKDEVPRRAAVEAPVKRPVSKSPVVEPKPQRVTPLPVYTSKFTVDLESEEPQDLYSGDPRSGLQNAIYIPYARTAIATSRNVRRDRRDAMFSAYSRPSNSRHRLRMAGGIVATVAAAVFLGRVLVNELVPKGGASEPAIATTTTARSTAPQTAMPAPVLPVKPTTAIDTKKLPPEQPEVIQAKMPAKETQPLAKDKMSRNTVAVDADVKSQTLISQNIRPASPPLSTIVITYGSGKVSSRVEPFKSATGKRPIPVGKKGEESTRPRIVKNPKN